jgi:hypothetical protein
MGDAEDQVVLSKAFHPISRIISQMGTEILVSYLANEVKIDMGGKEQSIKHKGAFLSSAPGFELLAAGLGLQKGESIIVATDDMQSFKPKFLKIENMGEMDKDGILCNVYEITDATNKNEKSTYYFNKVSGVLIFAESIIPAMNNAVVTMKLR